MSEYGCGTCGRKPKHLPYGSKRKAFYCSKCDRGHSKGVTKKSERQKAKKLTEQNERVL